MYIKITPNMTTDHELVEDAMVKVSGLDRTVISLFITGARIRNPHRDFIQTNQ